MNPTFTVDYYKILHINFGAGKEDIISAYRRLCKLYHPDVNRSPGAEDVMKQINVAYSVLADDSQREAYDVAYRPGTRFTAGRSGGSQNVRTSQEYANGREAYERKRGETDSQRSAVAMHDYFSALLTGAYENAYWKLSNYDRQYVTIQSFCKWRRSVSRLFSMREFVVKGTEITQITLEDGRTVQARKHYINITEKNTSTQAVESYQATKFTIYESGSWRVFLGYRDLNEIAKMFENLSQQQEKGEMAKHWEEYCQQTCRELDMLSLAGLARQAEREIYRHKRYGQTITIACFAVAPRSGFVSEEGMANILESAAETITGMLRETDIPAYLGGGRFAVVYVELKKRHADAITRRLAESIKKNASAVTRSEIRVGCAFSQYSGGTVQSAIDKLLKNI